MALRRWCTILVIAVLASSVAGQGVDLPVATGGLEAWAEIVGKAVSFGGKNQEESLQALKSFQGLVNNRFQKQVRMLEDVSRGNFTDLIHKLLTPKVQIDAPVFFDNSPAVFKSSAKLLDLSWKGVKVEPCLFVVNPIGVAVGATGINISPVGVSVAPTAVNVNPFALSINPSLIVIAPFDTTVAGQGLNIAPALIAISPVKTVVNPVGPLQITDSLISEELPALP